MRPTPSSVKRGAALLPVAAVLAFPLSAKGSIHDPHARSAGTTIALGDAFGGLTAQGWPLAFAVKPFATRIVWIATGLELKCTSGDTFNAPDGYRGLRVSKRRTFAAKFGPTSQRNADGTSAVGQGSMKGALNRSRQKASGTWQLKVTFLDAAGAMTDSCDSGVVQWRAIQ